ncbi:MAG: hypothetical protein F6K41_24915 [Symploca sp. SIO3E6]|nr:hypothetical protein [Caldora sp. SIO3E6]
MALPSNFSHTEHLQDFFRKTRNKRVREWFRDVGDENWEPTLSGPRSDARIACTHRESDSALDTLLRIEAFKDTQQIYPAASEITIFGTTPDNISFEYAPIIKLYFSQASLDVAKGESYLKGDITFRLVNETSETITITKLRAIAQKIKDIFGTGSYKWHKGKKYYYYKRKAQGYDFRVLALNTAEAKRLIKDVHKIQGHEPDWQYLTLSEVDDEATRFPTTPKTRKILGETRTRAKYRRVGKVRFRYAAASIFEYGTVNLVDLTGLRRNPLIT